MGLTKTLDIRQYRTPDLVRELSLKLSYLLMEKTVIRKYCCQCGPFYKSLSIVDIDVMLAWKMGILKDIELPTFNSSEPY